MFERYIWVVLRLLCVGAPCVHPARPVEECVVTLGGYGGKVFEVTPDEGVVIGAPLALTIKPETGDPTR